MDACRKSSPRRVHRTAQRGVSLIEVLIALVIFAFGTLGLAGLQVRVLASGQSALFRSQATALTDDVLDRMRADRTNAKGGNWNTTLAEASSAISGTSIAKTDLKDWKQSVEALLPSGQASVTANASEVTIVIRWLDDRKANETTTFTTKTRL